MVWTRRDCPQGPVAAGRARCAGSGRRAGQQPTSSSYPVRGGAGRAAVAGLPENGCAGAGRAAVASRRTTGAAGRRRTGESQTKLAVQCHHRAGNGAFCGEGTAHHRDPREPAMPDPSADHEPELLTITEAADVRRAPVANLRYWRPLGKEPTSFRLGRRVVCLRPALRTWID